MELSRLLEAIADARSLPIDPKTIPSLEPADGAVRVAGIAEDSRRVQPGDLFVALSGSRFEGMEFIAEAIRNGAAAVVGPDGSRRFAQGLTGIRRDVPVVEVGDPRRVLSMLSAHFYGEPTRTLKTIGVTGTNGKTTTAHMIAHLLGAERIELISTVTLAETGRPSLTTPSSIDVHRMARQAVEAGKSTLIIEASSIGLEMHRLADVWFDVAVWMGVTPEHLGFHGTMRSYAEAKLKLVRSLGPEGICAAYAADPLSARVEQSCRGRVIRFGTGGSEEVAAQDLDTRMLATVMTLCIHGQRIRMRLPVPGEHNVINALAAASVANGWGMDVAAIVKRLERFPPVSGRFEAYRSPSGVLAIIDFAHTPDAIARILCHLRTHMADPASRLIVVFGCTGDADREKRHEMGRAAGALADLAVVTADNPKFASVDEIAADVVAGVKESGGRSRIQLDRRQAIVDALAFAGERDVVLVAGKGHETHQVVAGRFEAFSDRCVLLESGCGRVAIEGTADI